MNLGHDPNLYGVPISKPRKLPDDTHPWFFHPNRVGVRFAPSWFKRKLDELGDEFEVTWNPLKERWLVWIRAPYIQTKIVQGWKLLFVHEDIDKAYMPLDERLLARMYNASVMKHGSARNYVDRVIAEVERDRERQYRQDQQDQIDMAMPYFEHSQIKNIGKGNKFSTYHS